MGCGASAPAKTLISVSSDRTVTTTSSLSSLGSPLGSPSLTSLRRRGASRGDRGPEPSTREFGLAGPLRELEHCVLLGHSAAVCSVLISRDGRTVVVSSKNQERRGGEICVWDTLTESRRMVLQGHSLNVWSVAMSADERRLVSAGGDNSVRLWELGTGACELVLNEHARDATSVAISADGRRIVSVSWDVTLRVWDADTGRCLHTLRGSHTRKLLCVTITPDGSFAASAGQDGKIAIWDLREVESGALSSEQPQHMIDAHIGFVHALHASDSGRHVVSAGADGRVCVWDRATGACVRELRAHEGAVLAVAVTHDASLIVTGGVEGEVRVWHAASGRLLGKYADHGSAVTAVSLCGTAHCLLIASGSSDGTVRVRRWADDRSGAGEPRRSEAEHRAAKIRERLPHRHTVSSVETTLDEQAVSSEPVGLGKHLSLGAVVTQAAPWRRAEPGPPGHDESFLRRRSKDDSDCIVGDARASRASESTASSSTSMRRLRLSSGTVPMPARAAGG